jgi:hypothetical protein
VSSLKKTDGMPPAHGRAQLAAMDEMTSSTSVKLSRLAERMLDLGPTTPAGIAAVAATLREDNLAHYWEKPARDRDYDVELVTRFIDGLIGATVGGAA